MSSLLCLASCKLPKCNIRQKAHRLTELISPLKTKIVRSSLVQSIKRKKKQHKGNSMDRTSSEPIRDNLNTSSVNLDTASNSEYGLYTDRSMTGVNIPSRNQLNTEQQTSMSLYPNYYVPQLRSFHESPPPELSPTPIRNNQSVSGRSVPYTAPSETWRIGGLQGRYANQDSEPMFAIINPTDRENRVHNAPMNRENRVHNATINRVHNAPMNRVPNAPMNQENRVHNAPINRVHNAPMNRVPNASLNQNRVPNAPINLEGRVFSEPINLEDRVFSRPINLEDQVVNEPVYQGSPGPEPFFVVRDPINRENRVVPGLTTDQSSSASPEYNPDQRRSPRRQSPCENVGRYTGSRYRSINNNVVRIYSTGNNYRQRKPHPIRYIDTPAYQATRPECMDNNDHGPFIVQNRKNFLQNGLIRMLDPQELSLKNPLENWRIGGNLGSGVNGTVKVARSRFFYSRTTYASKTVFTRPYHVNVDENHHSVLTEVRIMKAKHPNIVNLKHVFLQNNAVTMFMDRQLTCVFDVLDRLNHGMEEDLALYVTHEVLKGLHYMYNALGYFHGDIKTENVLVGPRGEIKLADFGHSKPIGIYWEGSVGTDQYMAPEVSQPNRTFNEKSDIWSLALFIELMLMFTDYSSYSSYEFYRDPMISSTLKIIVSSMLHYNGEYRPSVNQLLATFEYHFRHGNLLLGTNKSMEKVLRKIRFI